MHSESFQTFFVQAFKTVVDSWKFTKLLLYILWDDWPIFMISGSDKQLQQKLEYTLLKPDFHSWWFSKMQSGCEDTLEERYAIKFCFKLGQNATETYGMLQTAFRPSYMNWSPVFEWHKRFKEDKESVRDDERCGGSNWRCLWCNFYRHRKWTRRQEFKSWMRLITFHIALIPLGKVWIQLFPLQL